MPNVPLNSFFDRFCPTPNPFTEMLPGNLPPEFDRGSLSYLINTPKAFRILLIHKIRDARFRHLLTQWAFLLLALVGFGVGGFFLVPTIWAVGAFAPCLFLFALFLSIGAGDLFLKFALEDQRFLEMATQSRALSVFQDDDESLPRPV